MLINGEAYISTPYEEMIKDDLKIDYFKIDYFSSGEHPKITMNFCIISMKLIMFVM